MKFSQLDKEKRHENNSPRKEKILGNEPQKQYSETMGLTMKNFKQPYISKYNRQVQSPKKEVLINERLPQQYSPKNQQKREGNIFFKCTAFINLVHPEYVFKENEVSVDKQKDRRKNLKKLEKLFIYNNQKNTREIYESK